MNITKCVQGETDPVTVQGGQPQAPAKKAGQKSKSSAAAGVRIEIKDDWVAEHATQVAPLVPGGKSRPSVPTDMPDESAAIFRHQFPYFGLKYMCCCRPCSGGSVPVRP